MAILQTQSRPRAVLGLLCATVLVPLAILLLGLWEAERGRTDLAKLEGEQQHLQRIASALEARMPRDGRVDWTMQFRWGGQSYGGPLALNKAREALADVKTTVAVARARRLLPPAVIAAAGLAASLSVCMLLASAVLGRLGRTSREVLVRGFSLIRHVLPVALGAQVVLATVAFVAVVTFEAAALMHPGSVSGGEIKLLLIAVVFALGSLWVAGSTLLQLRRTLAAFEPDPLPIVGRLVAREEAPGLWRLLDALAERLEALPPDHVVAGLTEGFHVTSGPKVLEPGGQPLAGRTLHLPLPYLPFLRADEFVAIVGHELAHFSGGDTAYSLRFLPIYAGVGRSLDAVATGGVDGRGAGSPLLKPALRLGVFVMDQFHHAVRHWSRQREFAADAAGAELTSPEAAARALMRTAAIQPRIAEVLDAAAAAPGTAPVDLVAAVVKHTAERGLDDPSAHLEEAQPHPTDTHPPTRQRLAALKQDAEPRLIADAATVRSSEAHGSLVAYFADPVSLCRAATADFLGVVRRNAAAHRAHLEGMAAKVGTEERVLSENFRGAGIFLLAFGGILALIGLGLAILAPSSLHGGADRIVVAVAIAAGTGLIGYGLVLLRRGERPFLVLRYEELAVPGLDRAIPWADIANLDMTLDNKRMVTRLLLPPGVPFPNRIAGGRRVKLDTKRRIVTVTAGLPRGMKPQAFADLIDRYRAAAEARGRLAEKRVSVEPPPAVVPSVAA